MMYKKQENTWYSYVDINYLLHRASNNQSLFLVEDAASNDETHATQRVNSALESLSSNPGVASVVVPINLGNKNAGVWQGLHWVTLVIRREIGVLKAYYNDSYGTPMETSVAYLKQILINHDIAIGNITDLQTAQQSNGYDCGPWTVLNSIGLASNGQLPGFLSKDASKEVINQQRQSLPMLSPLILNKDIVRALEKSKAKEAQVGLGSGQDPVATLTEKTKALQLESRKTPKFVASGIVYVPEREYEEDSSDDEPDEEFLELLKSKPFPYYAKKKTHVRKIDFKDEQPNEGEALESLVVNPILKLLEEGAYEEDDKHHLKEDFAVSLALNRMRSVSSRKNNSLKDELGTDTSKGDVKHTKFGFFWECQWYKRSDPKDRKLKDKEVGEVRTFYKKLKKHDPDAACDFLRVAESGVPVPYQRLREYAKNHDLTKSLVREHRQSDADVPIYLALIDGDTVSFNGVYSSYSSIGENITPPTVMSTGYVFSDKEFHMYLSSLMDLNIRIITAKHLPSGVYYPEPNTCILIPAGFDTVPESFRDSQCKDETCEAAAILRQVKDRDNASFTFTTGNPIITTTPPRAYKTKKGVSDLSFSPGAKGGASPNNEDFSIMAQVSQSHQDPYVWAINLYINRGFSVSCAAGTFRSLIAKIRKEKGEERSKAVSELKQYVDPDKVVDAIVKAWDEVSEYIEQFKDMYARSDDEQQLLEIIDAEEGLEIKDFSREKILILSRAEVVSLIEDGILNITDLKNSDIKVIEAIFYSEVAIELLQEGRCSFAYLLRLLELSDKYEEDFEDILESFEYALGEYGVEEFLERYSQDPLHLEFMSGDPTDIVLENSDDMRYIEFGIKHYDVDVGWIQQELNGDREDPSASSMFFEAALLNIDGDNGDGYESSLGGYSDFQVD